LPCKAAARGIVSSVKNEVSQRWATARHCVLSDIVKRRSLRASSVVNSHVRCAYSTYRSLLAFGRVMRDASWRCLTARHRDDLEASWFFQLSIRQRIGLDRLHARPAAPSGDGY